MNMLFFLKTLKYLIFDFSHVTDIKLSMIFIPIPDCYPHGAH